MHVADHKAKTKMRVLQLLMAAAALCAASASALDHDHDHDHDHDEDLEKPQREAFCVRWRATGGCDPHGVREPHNDAACAQTVVNGRSGYCECEGRRRVREVTCDHHEFTCEQACAEDSSAELSCA